MVRDGASRLLTMRIDEHTKNEHTKKMAPRGAIFRLGLSLVNQALVTVTTLLDHDHLAAVAMAAVPAIVAMAAVLRAGAVTVVLTLMIATATLDDDGLCAGD